MARMILRCNKCHKEVTLDPLEVLEGTGTVLADCSCHWLRDMVATIQEACIRASQGEVAELN